jgi:hypothetical protein
MSEEKEQRGEKAYADTLIVKSTNIFDSMQMIVNKILLIDFLKDSSSYHFFLFLLWLAFAGVIYSFSFGRKSSQTVFVIYCCNVWFIALAFLFLFIVRSNNK